MSGGVDSAVAAALLKKNGFNVRGVFLRLADTLNFKEGEEDAGKIAQILEIPFSVFDFRKEFKKKVIEYFLEELQKGVTPNPCVVCNEEIKLGLLLEKVLNSDSFYLATGHYVQRSVISDKGKETYKLLMAKDKDKDQSYFLWQLNQNKLRHLLFPLGNLTKPEVRGIAKKFGFFNLIRSESKEICFVRDKLRDFLKERLKPKPGKIVNTEGSVVGQHEGLYFYTIGQRKGIEIGGVQKPFYVSSKDLENNVLIVTQNEKDLYKEKLEIRNVNWILGKVPELPLEMEVKIRYRHKPVSAVITNGTELGSYNLDFKEEQKAVTPGQSAVFYKGEELLGGGIIR